MTQKSPDRRDFLRGILSGAVLLPLLRPADLFAADTLPRLALSDPAATALGYVENAGKIDPAKESTYKPGSKCANCALYQNAAEQKGYAPCSVFPGKSVNGSGWCRAWAAKS